MGIGVPTFARFPLVLQPRFMGAGPAPPVAAAGALLGLLGEANHLTLAECRDRLAERTGVRVHPWTVGRALRRCGWT